jgi:hypothetical protein
VEVQHHCHNTSIILAGTNLILGVIKMWSKTEGEEADCRHYPQGLASAKETGAVKYLEGSALTARSQDSVWWCYPSSSLPTTRQEEEEKMPAVVNVLSLPFLVLSLGIFVCFAQKTEEFSCSMPSFDTD